MFDSTLNPLWQRYILAVQEEVKPALGCTEPISLALAAAVAAAELEGPVERVEAWVSPNLMKNGLGVTVPGTGMVGLPIAAALGALGGNANAGLEVLKDSTAQAIADAKALLELSGCDGVAIGRGALGNPWIFREIKQGLAGRDPLPAVPLEIQELCLRHARLMAEGKGEDRAVIDPSIVRGLGYYTGPVFEAELTFEILDEKGRKRQFGSVAGGGRYDGLVERFTGQKVPATGVSIGVDRLLAALRAKGMMGGVDHGPVVVTVMDRDRMGDYQAMAAELRGAGIRAEVYLGNPKNFGNQLKYADKRNAPVAIIQGGDEAARGVVQVKDLILGAKIAAEASHEEWKAQPAQTEIARADLVAEVRRILG